jgi:hypothetical protein
VFLLEPLSSHGTFAITDLHASTIWSYLQEPLPVDIRSGTIAVKGEYNFDIAGDAPAIKIDVHDTTVSDLKLRPRQGTTDYVVLGKLDVQETKVDLTKRAVEIGKVSLTGGEVNAWLSPQGQLNLLELTTPAGGKAAAGAAPTAAGAAPPSTTPPPAWVVTAPDITVDAFRVAAEDRQLTPALAVVLDSINIHVAGFNTAPAARLDVTARTTINGSSILNTTAQLSPGGGDVTAHVDLAQFDLAVLQPFIAQRTAMTLQSGRLATQLDIKKAADGTLSVKGDVGVAGLRTVDELKQSFIKWKDLRVAGIQYNSQPASLQIASITAHQPYARVIIAPDRTVNVQVVLAGPSKGAPSLATQLGDANAKAGGVTVAGVKGGSPAAQAEVADIKAEAADAKATAAAADAKANVASAGASATAAAADANAKLANAAASASAATADANANGGKTNATAKGSRHSRKSQSSQAGAASASTESAAPVMPMAIGTVRVIDGSVNYADFWIKPNFAVGIQSLNGTIDGLSSDPKSRAKVKLEGKVDRYAPVSINGQLNLLAATVYSDIKMSFKGLELTTMTPYSGHFAGYKIDKGKLSVDLSYKVDQRKLDAEQHFVIDQLQLGEAVDSPDAVHLPLKLAVALLKDRNGVIDLPLPITGSLDDPQFKVGPIIWHALINLLEKAVTAPFAALGRLFGGHGEDMKFIDFTAGSAELDSASKEKLESLTKALQEHTQLQLDVPIAYSQDIDGPVLAKQKLNEKLVARAHGDKGTKKPVAQASGKQASNKQNADASQGAASAAATASAATPSGGTPPATPQAASADASQAANQPPEPLDPALGNPLEHYRLLLAEYQAELGKDADLPATAAAIQNAKNKKDAPPVETAIPELEDAIAGQIGVSDLELQALGKRRTRAIQDVLLAEGGIDASRVFIINAPAKTDDSGKVRVEMALK